MRILVLDDDIGVRRMLRRVFEYEGHNVAIASSVAEAKAHPETFDLAVLDIDLPDGTGVEVAEDLLERNATERIVFFTASTTEKDLGRAAALGCVIRKVAGLKALLAIV